MHNLSQPFPKTSAHFGRSRKTSKRLTNIPPEREKKVVCNDVVRSLVSDAPNLRANPRIPTDNLLCLTGRHFPAQVPYRGNASKKSHSFKRCCVCYVMNISTPSGHPIKLCGSTLIFQDNQGYVLGSVSRSFIQTLTSASNFY